VGARALILVVPLWLACSGPRPSVDGVRVTPGPLPGRYRVEATVTNRARGEGQVEVRIELRDRRSGRVVETERDLPLHGHEEAHLTADVEAPAGDWDARVSADYPPQ